jgi:hypothetical protein
MNDQDLITPPTPKPLVLTSTKSLPTHISSKGNNVYKYYWEYVEKFKENHSFQDSDSRPLVVVNSTEAEVVLENNVVSISGIYGIGIGQCVDVVVGKPVSQFQDTQNNFIHVQKVLIGAMVMDCGMYASSVVKLTFGPRRTDQTESVATSQGVVIVAINYVQLGNRNMRYPVRGDALSALVSDYRHHFDHHYLHPIHYPPVPTHVPASPAPAPTPASTPASTPAPAPTPAPPVSYPLHQLYQAQLLIAGMVRRWLARGGGVKEEEDEEKEEKGGKQEDEEKEEEEGKQVTGIPTKSRCWTCDDKVATHSAYRDALGCCEWTCDECHRDEYPEDYEEEEENEENEEKGGKQEEEEKEEKGGKEEEKEEKGGKGGEEEEEDSDVDDSSNGDWGDSSDCTSSDDDDDDDDDDESQDALVPPGSGTVDVGEEEGVGTPHWQKRATMYLTVVVKKFKSVGKFTKELDIYSRNLPYVPDLVAYDESKGVWTLKIKRVGDSCKGERGELIRSKMEELGERLRRDTGIHHGDIAPVNVCYCDGKYYLIDFEKSKGGMSDVVCSPSTCKCYKYKK